MQAIPEEKALWQQSISLSNSGKSFARCWIKAKAMH